MVGAAGPDGRARYHAQVNAVYALLDRFRTAFPAVEIESCAGGGGRIDAGIIRRTHRFWTSDCIDAVTRLHIQPGFLQYMPPEVMGSHIGTAPAHSTGPQPISGLPRRHRCARPFWRGIQSADAG